MTKHNDDILQFLCQPENVPMVFEVIRYQDAFHRHFLDLFAQLFVKDLQNRYATNKELTKWRVENGNFLDSTVRRPTTSIRMKKEFLADNEFYLNSVAQRERATLRYGICWNKPVPVTVSLPAEVQTVEECLRKQSFNARTDWWLGHVNIPYEVGGELFVLQLAQNKAGFVREIIDPFWTMFTQIVDALEAANYALAQWQP